MKEAAKTGRATQAREGMEDLHSDMDEALTQQKLIDMASLLYDTPTAVTQLGLQPLAVFMAKLVMFLGMALTARGEDLRGLVFGCLAYTIYPTIGPLGMGVFTVVARSGKLSTSGRRTRSGFIAHKNPLICPANAYGMCVLYRFICHNEEMVSWAEGDYPSLFRPILRSLLSGSTTMSYHNQDIICANILRR